MTRYLTTVFFLLAFITVVKSQGMRSVLDKSTNPGLVLIEFDDRFQDTKGTYFIDENWNAGEVEFRSGTIVKDFPIRYDLLNNMLEIKIEDQIKVLPIRKMNGFKYASEEPGGFVRCEPCAKYRYEDETPLTGVCRKYAEGQIGLFTRYEYILKDPDYVVALDMGTKEAEIHIKEKPLLYVNDHMYEVTGSKKQICSLFGDKTDRIREYAKRENLNPKKILDLKLMVDFYNNELAQ